MEQKVRYHRETVNGCAFRMRYLEGGVFEMGSFEKGESPIHKVELSPFYIAEYPVTQALWKAVMEADNNPSRFIGDNRPVEQVSWLDIVEGNQDGNGTPAFLQKLNNATKFTRPAGYAYRLPTEAEWEYAARGGIEGGTYPWGGPYVISDTGCFMANFKPQRGDYAADAALYTVEAKSYEPNDFNLYNMAGNVSEWTNSSYDPGAYDYVSTMNPNAGAGQNRRKVIRGGSWKDVAYFLQVSTRDYEYQDSARSYIGFRTVQDYMGEEDSTRGQGLPNR